MALEKEMIKPFIAEQKRGNAISYGLSSFGYDARVSNEFKIFTDVDSAIVDPKNFKNNSFVSRKIVCYNKKDYFSDITRNSFCGLGRRK